MKELFLDSNAHLPMCKPAVDAFVKTNSSLGGHGHPLSPSAPGRSAERTIEQARGDIAKLLGVANPNQIFFTSTCTEACEWGLQIFKKILPEESCVWTSPSEHPAVSQALNSLYIGKEIAFHLEVDENVVVKTSNSIPDSSGAVCILVQNEIGTIQPVFDLKTKHLFVDMSQAPGKMKIPPLDSIKNLDVAVFGAHKFGGPASVGFIYVKDVNYWIKKGTGSRYFLDRAGTPDICSIAATAAALKHSFDTFEVRKSNMEGFKAVLEPELESLGFQIVARDADRVPGTTFARVPEGKHSHVLMHMLGQKGIYIGLGSACGSVHSGTSPLLKILSRVGTVKDFVRISQYGNYGSKDAEYFIQKLKGVL